MPEIVESSHTKSQSSQTSFNADNLADYLRIYYKRLFPHKDFYRWLSYGLSEDGIFINREFSFTLQDDIYIRFQSFENQAELEKEIISKCPHKIDIGAIYNVRPKDHRINKVTKPLQRELVFDIDMTDYDEVRTCCSEANVCSKCWKFMTIACKIIDAGLREDFGFEHILWVFSGRRGIHCWVCDKSARHMDGRTRSAVAEYLNILVGAAEGSVTKVNLPDKIHPSIKRSLKIITPLFDEIVLEDQNMFGTPEGVKKLILMVPDESVRNELEKKLEPFAGDSKKIWEVYKSCMTYQSQMGGPKSRKYRNIEEETMLAFTYPRIDINVSKGINHLLKAPFCIHPKTGKVCVPFNPNTATKFDPTDVPTVNGLLDEVNEFDKESQIATQAPEERSRIKDYKKTSIYKGMMVFETFLRKLEQSYKGKAIVVSDAKMEF